MPLDGGVQVQPTVTVGPRQEWGVIGRHWPAPRPEAGRGGRAGWRCAGTEGTGQAEGELRATRCLWSGRLSVPEEDRKESARCESMLLKQNFPFRKKKF